MEAGEDIYDAVAKFREANPDWYKVLTNSTFQTTHNNAMKPQIVIYAGKGKLSETVQNLLFSEGITWGPTLMDKIMFLDENLYLSVKWDSERFEYRESSDRIVQDYSADTEMGKITEWLEWRKKEYGRVLLGRENERLKREIIQLRDELDAKSAVSFPEEDDWHNPCNLSPEQVEVKDGWRLLLKEEINGERDASYDLQIWSIIHSKWCMGYFYGASENHTYRTKWPLPSLKNTPTSHPDTKAVSESTDDDFPTPERQEKEAGLRWFLEYLKRCKEVSFIPNEGINSYTFNYGKSNMGYYFGENDGRIGVIGRNGEVIDITITQINP